MSQPGSAAGALAAVDVQDLACDERPGGFEVEDAGHHVADLADVPDGIQLREGRVGFRRVRARPVRGQAAVKVSFPRPCTGRIAAACAEIFNMLADAIPYPVLRRVLNSGAGSVQNTSRWPARSRCRRSDHRRRAGPRW